MTLRLVIGLLGCSLILAGCGTATTIEGRVQMDGKPLPNGVISFHSADSVAGYGGSDAGGKYSVQPSGEGGLQPGDYKVTVYAVEATDPATAAAASSSPHTMEKAPTRLTPDVYADPKTTPLTASVKAGKNLIPLELKSQ